MAEDRSKSDGASYANPVFNSDLDKSDSRNEQKSNDLKTNEDSEKSGADLSKENPIVSKQDQKGNSTQLDIGKRKVFSFFKSLDQNKAFFCFCGIDETMASVLREKDCLQDIRSMKCKNCKEKMKVNPCWKFDDKLYKNLKNEIFLFLQCQNPSKPLCCNCGTHDKADIIPTKRDNFGIATWVGCIKCGEEMSLKITTVNRNKLTMIENENELKPGNELMFRRWYGISHHAIYIGDKETEPKEGNNPTDTQNEENPPDSFHDMRSSGVRGNVISPTFDEEDARVKESNEHVEGIDVYRVEYDNCYSLQWTLDNARSAKEFAKVCRDQAQQLSDDRIESNYDPFMENCEHFARRCKTGQSESRQVQACLYNCGTNIAMLVLRITFLAIWWISLAVVEALEKPITYNPNATNETSEISCPQRNEKMTRMEVAVATSLGILLLILKVVLSSIAECNKMTRSQETSQDNPKLGDCAISCYRCCCNCCPKKCYGFRYLCRLLFCLVPIHLCQKNSSSCFSGCTCKCKQFCDHPTVKSCCRIYAVITIRVAITEAIVIGIPIACFATFMSICYRSLTWAARGFLFTLPFVLVLSVAHSSISTITGRIIGCCCRRCCCNCCCKFKDSQ